MWNKIGVIATVVGTMVAVLTYCKSQPEPPQPIPHVDSDFELLSGYVRHKPTNRLWAISPGSIKDYPPAKAYCEKLTWNKSAWKLPSYDEIQTLCRFRKKGTCYAYVSEAFPNPGKTVWLEGAVKYDSSGFSLESEKIVPGTNSTFIGMHHALCIAK